MITKYDANTIALNRMIDTLDKQNDLLMASIRRNTNILNRLEILSHNNNNKNNDEKSNARDTT